MGSITSRTLAFVAVAAVLLGAALSLPVRHLTEPDEARYAEVAREMVETGNWLVPHLNGVPYTHKPPLYIWMVAALRLLGLSWTPAAVAPGLLAFLLTLALVPSLGRALALGRDVGPLAVVVLASTPLFAGFALIARMDMMLVATHTAAVLALAHLRGDGTAAPARRRWHLVFWLAVALGILVKGPVALALALLTAAAWSLAIRPSPLPKAVLAGWGPLLCLAVVLAWLVPAGLAGGRQYLDQILFHQTLGRVTGSFAHPQPFYYHFVAYPLATLPWTPVVLAALVRALRRRREHAGFILALAVVVGLAFFSALSGKIVIYLLPMFPFASLLAAQSLSAAEPPKRWLLAVAGAGIAALGLAVVVAPHLRREFVDPALAAQCGGVLMVAAGVWALVRTALARPALHALVLGGLLFPAAVLPHLLAAVDRGMTLFETGQAVARLEPGAGEVFTVGLGYYGVPLYADRIARPLTTSDETRSALAAGRVVVARRASWDSIGREMHGPRIDVTVPDFAREPIVVLRAAAADAAAAPGDQPRHGGANLPSISRQTSSAPVAP